MSSHPFGAGTGYYEYKASPYACGEPLAEGQAIAKRWPVQGRKGYFLALDLDLLPEWVLKGPDNMPIRYVILEGKP